MRKALSGLLVVALVLPLTGCGRTLQITPQAAMAIGEYDGDDIDSGTELSFGIGGKVRAGNPFFVDAGVFWTTLGGVIDDGFEEDDVNISVLRFPVTAGLHLPIPILDTRVFAGPVLNVRTSVGDSDFDLDDDDVKSTMWAGRVGAGVSFTLIAIDFAYEFGFTDVFESSAGFGDVKQDQWVVEAGINLGI